MDETALVGLLEAIYAIERDDGAWLEEVLAAIRVVSGAEHTYLGYFYDAADVEAFNLWNVRSLDQPPEVDAAFRSTRQRESPELLNATLRTLRVGSIRRSGMPHMAALFAERQRVGWGDIFSVNGLDPSGIGCLLTIGTRQLEYLPPANEMAIYVRIANHVATAFRCRRRLGISKLNRRREIEPNLAAAEAVLDEKGRFVHAEGLATSKTARQRIRNAAQSLTVLRTKARKSGRAVLDAWHPLLDARWTLVDSFEENGRRYVVARENQARSAGLDMLTNRERQVVLQASLGYSNKEIAYALGISDSTVRVLMARAAGRFGASSRAELLSHSSLRCASGRTEHDRTSG